MANNPATIFLLIVLLILFLTPDPQQPSILARQALLNSTLTKEHTALNILNASRFGDFAPSNQQYLNLTGLRKQDNFAWELLPNVTDRATQQFQDIWGDETVNQVEKVANTSLPVYANLTGWARGEWTRSSKVGVGYHAPHLNLSEITSGMLRNLEKLDRNITGPRGKIFFQLSQVHSITVAIDGVSMSDLSMRMTIRDETSYSDGWVLRLYGVHDQNRGAALLATSSDKFEGLFALPHFAQSQHAFVMAQRLLNQSITETMRDQAEMKEGRIQTFDSKAKQEDEASGASQCEFIVYLQQFPLDGFTTNSEARTGGLDVIHDIEDELRFPIGVASSHVPNIRLSMLIFSPDCGFVLESVGPPEYAPEQGQHLWGVKKAQYMKNVVQVLLTFLFLMVSQVALLTREMKDASTPSAKSRISFYTLAIQAVTDLCILITSLVAAFNVSGAFVNFLLIAFVAFLSGACFGMKFLMEIWNVQEPERLERERRRRRAIVESTQEESSTSSEANHDQSTGSAQQTSVSAEQTLPLPVTAPRPLDTGASPIIISSDQDEHVPVTAAGTTPASTEPTSTPFGAVYTRMYLLVVGTIFFTGYVAGSWSTRYRSLYINTLVFIYLSRWVPQIYRNILRNCRRAFTWTFVVGQTVIGLIPVIYLWGFEDNVAFFEPDRDVLLGFVAWAWLQILVLFGQQVISPRFLVNENWAWVPAAWEYHPVLREDEEGTTLPLGASSMDMSAASSNTAVVSGSDGEGKPDGTMKGKKVFDCAICQADIEVEVVPLGGPSRDETSTLSGLSSQMFARRAYMVTPCRHIFHTPCLESWLRYRLQCPICRETLPPL